MWNYIRKIQVCRSPYSKQQLYQISSDAVSEYSILQRIKTDNSFSPCLFITIPIFASEENFKFGIYFCQDDHAALYRELILTSFRNSAFRCNPFIAGKNKDALISNALGSTFSDVKNATRKERERERWIKAFSIANIIGWIIIIYKYGVGFRVYLF